MTFTALVQLIQNHLHPPWQPLAWISQLLPRPKEKRTWLAWAVHQAEELLELDLEGLGLPRLSNPSGAV